jgi:small-conductance mechanosensitive channel
MDSPERGALMLVRFIAIALMGWAVAELALYWAIAQHNHTPLETGKIIIKSLPFLAGVIVLIKAKALAEWISNFLDD